MPGTLFVVATPIGNLEDITARALRVLREVDLIAAEDTRRTQQLLTRYGIRTRTTSLHVHNEHRKAPKLIERMQQGESMALVSDAGTPTLSDPGAALVRACVAAGIRVEPIPGPSAITGLLSASGFSSQTFTFLGFVPNKGVARDRWFQRLKTMTGVAVFFEAPHRIAATICQLTETCPDCQVAIGREMTKSHEEILRGRPAEFSELPLSEKGEFTIAIEFGQNTEHGGESTEIGLLANLDLRGAPIGRQQASQIAAILGLKTNDVYAALLDSSRDDADDAL